MKIIRFIFAIYIIALSVYPCSDRDTCADEIQSDYALTDISDHDHSEDESDLCSPFCTCSCCAAHIQLSFISDLDLSLVIHNTKETIPYIEKQTLSDYTHIWQPPRI